MKIHDMTDTLFAREVQGILGDIQFWAVRLGQIGEAKIVPMPVSQGDRRAPFPLALDLRDVWDYARGVARQPEGMQDIIQTLCELLWCPVAAHTYEIPSSWWDEPLGFMVRLAWARASLDAGESLGVDDLALLAGLSEVRIKQLCQAGELKAEKVLRKNNTKQEEWAIPAEEAAAFLKKQGGR